MRRGLLPERPIKEEDNESVELGVDICAQYCGGPRSRDQDLALISINTRGLNAAAAEHRYSECLQILCGGWGALFAVRWE